MSSTSPWKPQAQKTVFTLLGAITYRVLPFSGCAWSCSISLADGLWPSLSTAFMSKCSRSKCSRSDTQKQTVELPSVHQPLPRHLSSAVRGLPPQHPQRSPSASACAARSLLHWQPHHLTASSMQDLTMTHCVAAYMQDLRGQQVLAAGARDDADAGLRLPPQ